MVAGIFKKIFDKTPTNLISNAQYMEIIKEKLTNRDLKVDFLKEVFAKSEYLSLLSVVLTFMSYACSFQKENLMTEYNMAVVFTPCFLRPLVIDAEYLKNVGMAVRAF